MILEDERLINLGLNGLFLCLEYLDPLVQLRQLPNPLVLFVNYSDVKPNTAVGVVLKSMNGVTSETDQNPVISRLSLTSTA